MQDTGIRLSSPQRNSLLTGFMEVQIMTSREPRAFAVRDRWSLEASGTFEEGVHLVSGDVGAASHARHS